MLLLVTGGTGFVGTAVRRVLSVRRDVSVRWAVRSPAKLGAVPIGHTVRQMDLTEPASLAGLADGVDAVLHLGHQIGGTDTSLELVNARGTAALLAQCAAEGVGRVVQLSTAAVYGPGPWHGLCAESAVTAPASSTTASRLVGDQHVLAGGGIVVRPHLVHGQGDRWVTPRALNITRRIGLVNGGRALHTMMPVQDLAAELVSHAVDEREGGPATVLAGGSVPVQVSDFLSAAFGALGERPPTRSCSLSEALTDPVGRADPRWRHDVGLLAHDHVLVPGRRSRPVASTMTMSCSRPGILRT